MFINLCIKRGMKEVGHVGCGKETSAWMSFTSGNN